MSHILIVALGGAVGATLRHLANLATLRMFGPGFPWGTLTVNIVGSFAMGLFIELLMRRLDGSQELRLLIATGVLGGFTTFSAFSLDFAVMWERGALLNASVYAVSSVVLSIAALFAGLATVRAFV
ncbi:fluoride efflux transporter CrcB [Hoeflea poritis]|uniref:Fluoride-specific ion channel FluC n=1 Tax=Hoeflea poritis TaxID=2993659 RepID=A0ABT4VGJ2_9HYPH|nr:fluoride efflux transporter CrcB [Hoeflea poritis]MDA4843828.1 fluoride efflux transporter CrcB [Hoeflea poritis]